MDNKPKPLFREPWLGSAALRALDSALHGSPQDALISESWFMSQLILTVLDRQRCNQLPDRELYDFYSFCQSNLARSNSQILQDLWVLFILGERRDGFFVEFGACDGITLSNTLLLARDYNWRGILAEPDHHWHNSLHRMRPESKIDSRCVAARSGERVAFRHVKKMPELSRMGDFAPEDVHEHNGNRSDYDEFEVETVSLSDLLSAHSAPRFIDYLSIDTEGSEFHILENFDFGEFSFEVITIEHAGEASKRKSIQRLLEENGYTRWRPEISRWDDWYVKSDSSSARSSST